MMGQEFSTMMRLRVLVGRRIREIRKERHLTQQTLAEKVGVSQNMIGCIERGTRFPSPETFERLSQVLKVDAGEFFRTKPADYADTRKRDALAELEGILREDPPEYVRMVGRIVQEMKKTRA
jgi:transcriptional regulator with XRE-family HTH domain